MGKTVQGHSLTPTQVSGKIPLMFMMAGSGNWFVFLFTYSRSIQNIYIYIFTYTEELMLYELAKTLLSSEFPVQIYYPKQVVPWAVELMRPSFL